MENTQRTSDPFWFEDPTVLLHTGRLAEFFPSDQMSRAERYNAMVRLSLYVSVLLYAYNRDIKMMYILIAVMLWTYVMNTSDDVTFTETLENGVTTCTQPTLDNPFMNPTMKDYLNVDESGTIVDRPPACDTADPEVKKKMDDAFNDNLYRDVNDVFGKMNSQRQFFTMPFTTIPNKQDEFARWLYLNPKTCKEDSDYCLRNEDVRAKRPVLGNPLENPK